MSAQCVWLFVSVWSLERRKEWSMFKFFSILMAVMLLAGAVAMADDLNPPPWRGEWSTTSQVWEFMTWYAGDPGGEGLRPDGPALNGMPPLPSTMVWVTPLQGAEWVDYEPNTGREGIWPLSGWIEVIVDNHEPPNEYKWVWVQLTWADQDPAVPSDPLSLLTNFGASGPDGPYAHDPVTVLEDLICPTTGWHNTTYEWFIRPNPVDETFLIEGNILVDELVIDTWCIPEPATLGLLLIGGLLVLRKRSR
jgi:hypothetical protein